MNDQTTEAPATGAVPHITHAEVKHGEAIVKDLHNIPVTPEDGEYRAELIAVVKKYAIHPDIQLAIVAHLLGSLEAVQDPRVVTAQRVEAIVRMNRMNGRLQSEHELRRIAHLGADRAAEAREAEAKILKSQGKPADKPGKGKPAK